MIGQATKECTRQGHWFRHPDTPTRWREYTDYSDCAFVGRERGLKEIDLRLALSTISLVFVLLAVGIFAFYGQYKIVRVKVHLNFFASLALTCLVDLLFYNLVRRRHFVTADNDNVLQKK